MLTGQDLVHPNVNGKKRSALQNYVGCVPRVTAKSKLILKTFKSKKAQVRFEPWTSTPRMVPLSHSAASYPPLLVATLYMPLLKKLVLALWSGRETKAETNVARVGASETSIPAKLGLILYRDFSQIMFIHGVGTLGTANYVQGWQ